MEDRNIQFIAGEFYILNNPNSKMIHLLAVLKVDRRSISKESVKPGGISFTTQGKERDNGNLLQDGSGEVGEKYPNSGNILKVKLW